MQPGTQHLCREAKVALGSNLTPKLLSLSFPTTHFQDKSIHDEIQQQIHSDMVHKVHHRLVTSTI